MLQEDLSAGVSVVGAGLSVVGVGLLLTI